MVCHLIQLDEDAELTASTVVRVRRGKLVVVPSEWVGVFTTKKTIRQRKFHKPRKRRQRKNRLRTDEAFDFAQQVDISKDENEPVT